MIMVPMFQTIPKVEFPDTHPVGRTCRVCSSDALCWPGAECSCYSQSPGSRDRS